jgi:hypothetical protein
MGAERASGEGSWRDLGSVGATRLRRPQSTGPDRHAETDHAGVFKVAVDVLPKTGQLQGLLTDVHVTLSFRLRRQKSRTGAMFVGATISNNPCRQFCELPTGGLYCLERQPARFALARSSTRDTGRQIGRVSS